MERNQKVTEWIQWKQWALSHPEFLDFKQNILIKFEDKEANNINKRQVTVK